MSDSTTPESLPSSRKLVTRSKRANIDKWPNLGACDICRSRKVKCIRVHENNQICQACTNRNNKCIITPNSRAKEYQKEILEARKQAAHDKIIVDHISHHSPDANLQRIELSEALMADLLATFFEQPKEQAPYAHHREIQILFEQAGRRLDRMAPAAEPFILAMCAAAAQVSDSPLLLGIHAPRLKELTRVQKSKSLLKFGQRRRAVCAQLARRTVELADTRGLFRKASIDSILVLILIPRILRYPQPWKGLEDMGDTWRPFMVAAFGHIRTLFELPGADLNKLGLFRWIMIINDAYNSALSGTSLLVIQSDLPDFLVADLPPLTPQMTRDYLLSSNVNQSIIPVIAFASESIKMGRLIAETISIPLRKRRQVSLSMFSERIQELTTYLQTLRACGLVAEEVTPLIPPANLEMQKAAFGVYMTTAIQYAPVSPTFLMLALHKQFELYTQHYVAITLMEEPAKSVLMEVRRHLDIGVLEAVFRVAHALQGLEGKEAVASLTRQTSMMIGIQEQLLVFFRLACEIRTVEQNGCSDEWTYSVKCQTLRLLLDAAQIQAWSWGDREEDLAACEFQYAQYENSAYYQTLSRPPTSEYLPTQGSRDILSATTSSKSSPFSPSDYASSTSACQSATFNEGNEIFHMAVNEPSLDTIADMHVYTDLWSRDYTVHQAFLDGA